MYWNKRYVSKTNTKFSGRRFQRVVSNGQMSAHEPTLAGVPQDSFSGSLFFLICINDLPKSLSSIAKPLADITFIFSIVKDVKITTDKSNRGLEKFPKWIYQWKIPLNLDLKKKILEVV